ncbi:unnamed protein product [Mytilus coruscus]|uniref:TRIM2_3 n=1 Tax=Mytilus coruscus TaxID=42192 RepID=A0A6J8ADK8_MYTCO|nr:unnamed protein product [Mytilus coruscus]
MTMHIETKTKIEVNIKTSIMIMICLSDGRIIIVEESGNVYLLTSDGKLQKQLPIPGNAFCVTQISKNTIAISYPDELTIKIFNIEDETVTKVIKLNSCCCGLSFVNESLVGLGSNEIRIIDLEGNTLKSLQVQNKLILQYLVYSDDRVIYSDHFGNAVNCIDRSGQQIWQYKQDLSGPEGLCTDTSSNIIVADLSSKIIVISKGGQGSKVLVRKEDGLKYPKCIYFRNNESYGFVCNRTCKYLAKYNLSYD